MRHLTFSLFLLTILFATCNNPREELPEEVIGMAPIYTLDDWKAIEMLPPQSITALGKLYYKSPYLYATDKNRGIHVFDNSTPEFPKKVAFIQIAGNSDMSIRGHTLYANNVGDLVAIDISQLDSIKIISRIEDAFKFTNADFPDGYVGYFECVNPELGEVIGWQETTITKPQCWR